MDFEDVYGRLLLVTGCGTQKELAGYFGVTQPSVSQMRSNRRVPDRWLVTLLNLHGVNPKWILGESNVMYLDNVEPEHVHNAQPNCAEIIEVQDFLDVLEKCIGSRF